MDWIIALLMKQPIIGFFVVIWVVGAINNVLKAKQKARSRSEAKASASTLSAPATRAESATGSAAGNAAGNADTIASRAVGGSKPGAFVGGMGTGQQKQLAQQRQAPASMRGRDRQVMPASSPAPVATPAPKTPDQVAREMRRILGLEEEPANASPAPARPTPPPMRSEPALVDPASVQMSKSPSNAKQHMDSHVGESMRSRQMAASKVGKTPKKESARGAIGNLGGRTKVRKKELYEHVRRYPMTDLRRAIVMSELLSPPIALRPGHGPSL